MNHVPRAPKEVLVIRPDPHNTRMFLYLEGDADVHTSPLLQLAIRNAIEQGFHHITVDCSQVVYLDATSLGVLVGGYKRCREINGRIDLIVPDGHRVEEIMAIVGLNKIFDIFASREHAMMSTAFAPSPA